jgi:uncharacterized protein GlcG (DUF336 family)
MRQLAAKSGRPAAALGLEPLELRALPDAAGTTLFLSQAYQDLLGRPIDANGASSFGGALDQKVFTRAAVALAIERSPEFRANQVQGLYEHFLKRPADPGGSASFTAALAAGLPVESFEASLLGSDEYYQNRGGGTADGFITALYADLFGRPADPTGRGTLEQALAAGASRTLLATELLASAEYRQDVVAADYQKYLKRSADAGGIATFAAGLGTAGNDGVVAALVGSDEYFADADPTAAAAGDPPLTTSQVGTLLARAAAATPGDSAIVAIVDRNGNILGVRVEGNVSPAITGNTANLVFAIDGAVSLARTGAFFANDQAPLTSRTVEFISQSTITEREVNSNPNVPDPNSPLRGPGLVAPISIGGHFPPGVPFTPPVDLFDIELTNRDGTINPGPDRILGTADDIILPNRFNVPTQFLSPQVIADGGLQPPNSYGFVSGLFRTAQSRGIATLPGGLPIFENGSLVGGIGVFFPGTTGFASEENSALSSNYNPLKPDLSLEAEYVAFAALGGSTGAGFSIGTLGGVEPLPGFDLPFGRIDLVGITLPIFGPGGTEGPNNLVKFGRLLPPGDPNSGSNQIVDTMGDTLLAGKPVPDGWLVEPHAGGGVTAADVVQIVTQGINQANLTRAAIRLPLGSRTRMVFAVSDLQGNVLGLFRMPDATIFSEDVAVAKARNVAYYDDPTQLQPADQVPGIAPGVAFTNRTFRYLAQPRYPEGLDGAPPGPFSILNDGGSNPVTGLNTGAPLPASAFNSVEGFVAFHPTANFHDPNNPANQNGVVFFPGSSALYKGPVVLVGGLGVSGDGVTQDDVVTFASATGFGPAPPVLRADQVSFAGARLPYIEFVRNPEG